MIALKILILIVHRKSFNELLDDSNRLAAGLVAIGLEPGDRIGIWGPNTYEWYLTQYAAAKAGLILVRMTFSRVFIYIFQFFPMPNLMSRNGTYMYRCYRKH